jgi:mannosyl-oligosaccharide glucosidase
MMSGPMLSARLESKQKEFEERYDQIFNVNNKIDSKELSVGRAALSNLLGGVGYFYGQSKIALPKGFTVSFRVSPDINSILLSQGTFISVIGRVLLLYCL